MVLSILGPIAFAFSVYDGFHASLTQWFSRYLSVYLWLPVSDLFSAVMARIQVLMVSRDVAMLDNPSFVPDSSNGVYHPLAQIFICANSFASADVDIRALKQAWYGHGIGYHTKSHHG